MNTSPRPYHAVLVSILQGAAVAFAATASWVLGEKLFLTNRLSLQEWCMLGASVFVWLGILIVLTLAKRD